MLFHFTQNNCPEVTWAETEFSQLTCRGWPTLCFAINWPLKLHQSEESPGLRQCAKYMWEMLNVALDSSYGFMTQDYKINPWRLNKSSPADIATSSERCENPGSMRNLLELLWEAIFLWLLFSNTGECHLALVGKELKKCAQEPSRIFS